MKSRWLVFVAVLLFSISVRLQAQAALGSATVNGTVRDASNLAIPEAAVVLTDTARGDRRETKSNGSGLFLFPNVPPGQYLLEAQKAGFDTKRITGVQLQVGQVATLDLTLQVGALSTVVSVSGEQSTIIDAESNVIGTVVNSQQVQQLPLNGRGFLQLALTASGS